MKIPYDSAPPDGDFITIPEVTLLDMPPLGRFASRPEKETEYLFGLKQLPKQTFTVNFAPEPDPDRTLEFAWFVVRRRHARGRTRIWVRNLTADSRPVYVLDMPERGRKLWRSFKPGERRNFRVTFPPDLPKSPNS